MNKKKISIITLSNVVNYGSVLQAYALQEKIKDYNFDVEIINYYPKRLSIFGMLKRIKDKNKKLKNPILLFIARIIILPSYVKRFSVFNKFRKKYFKSTKYKYRCDEDFIRSPIISDAFCTGSDQVWNSGWNEGISKPFYLTFSTKYKFSYAASFGKSEITDDEIRCIKPYLSNYKHISVREQSGLKILEKMGIVGTNVVDPTLLLTGNDWSKLASNKYKGKKYILMYNLNRNKRLSEYAKIISKKTGLKLIYISYNYHEFFKYGHMACNIKVEDFLSLIKYAKFVLTDSFHATAFSLNFNKNFYIIYPGKYSTRLQSILEITGLTNRVIESLNNINVNENINYNYVNEILDKERDKSNNFLKQCLFEIQNSNLN